MCQDLRRNCTGFAQDLYRIYIRFAQDSRRNCKHVRMIYLEFASDLLGICIGLARIRIGIAQDVQGFAQDLHRNCIGYAQDLLESAQDSPRLAQDLARICTGLMPCSQDLCRTYLYRIFNDMRRICGNCIRLGRIQEMYKLGIVFVQALHGICIGLELDLHRVCQDVHWNCIGWSKNCLSFASICQVLLRIFMDVARICVGSAKNLQGVAQELQAFARICLGFAQECHRICEGFAQDLHWICTGLASISEAFHMNYQELHTVGCSTIDSDLQRNFTGCPKTCIGFAQDLLGFAYDLDRICKCVGFDWFYIGLYMFRCVQLVQPVYVCYRLYIAMYMFNIDVRLTYRCHTCFCVFLNEGRLLCLHVCPRNRRLCTQAHIGQL